MRNRAGFSLVELMVALVLMGLLMAGMAQVLAGSLRGCLAVRDGLAAQRTLRWAAQALEGELRMAGFRFPPAGLRPPSASGGPAFLLLHAQAVLKVERGAARPLARGDEPFEPSGRVADVLGLIMDQPLPVAGTLAADLVGRPVADGGPAAPLSPSAPLDLSLCLSRSFALRAGDLLWVEGERLECFRILANQALRGGVPGTVTVAPPAGRGWPHAAGSRVGLARPLRVVYLTVAYLPLSGAERPVPCLVRLEAGWEGKQAATGWRQILAGWTERSESAVVLAEQVTGFQVACATVGPRLEDQPPDASADPALRMGSRQRPVLLAVTLTARAPGAPERRQSLRVICRPRNLGLAP